MGLTFVQKASEIVASSSTTVGQSYTTGTTLGSLLIVHTLAATGGSTYSVTDSLTNVYTQIGSRSPGGNCSAVYFAVNKSSGGNNVTFHSTASDVLTIYLAEYTGQAAGANPIDTSLGEQAWSEVGTGTVNLGSITTTVTNETLIMLGRNSPSGATLTPQDGSTVRSTANESIIMQDRNVAGFGTYRSAFSTNVSGSNGTGIFFGVKSTTSGTGPGFVQTINSGFGASALSIPLAFGSNNALGNLILVQVRFAAGNSGPFTCTDTQVNTYVTAYSALFSGGTQRFCSFYCLGCNGGANTITVAQGASNFIRAVAMEVSGVPSNSVVESTATFATGSGTVATTNNVTTAGITDYVVAYGGQISVNEASAPTVPGPFTVEISTVGGANDAALADATLTPGTYSTSFTWPTTTIWGAGLIAFRSGGGYRTLMGVGA
jgi:hypothetical protein